MSESGSSSGATDDEIEDPGRDPKGLNPPRNLFGGGPDQDSGRGNPPEEGDVGPADKPGTPTEDQDAQEDEAAPADDA